MIPCQPTGWPAVHRFAGATWRPGKLLEDDIAAADPRIILRALRTAFTLCGLAKGGGAMVSEKKAAAIRVASVES